MYLCQYLNSYLFGILVYIFVSCTRWQVNWWSSSELSSLNLSKIVIRIIFVWIFEFIFVWLIFEFIFVWNFHWYLSLVLGDNLICGPHLNWAVLVTFNELFQIYWPVLLYRLSFQFLSWYELAFCCLTDVF